MIIRAAKLSLLNFLSLFRDFQKPTRFGEFVRDLQKPTRFSGEGEVVAEFFRDLKKPTRFSGPDQIRWGGGNRNFPLSSVAKSNFYPTFSDIRG